MTTEAGCPPPLDSVTSKDWLSVGEPRAGPSLAHSVLCPYSGSEPQGKRWCPRYGLGIEPHTQGRGIQTPA